MDEEVVHQIVAELLASLEPLDTQSTAILHFLKAKGLASDKDLAPFLEQAENASNVRWRALRVRTDALISSAMKPPEKQAEAVLRGAKPSSQDSANQSEKVQAEKGGNSATHSAQGSGAQQSGAAQETEVSSANPQPEKNNEPIPATDESHNDHRATGSKTAATQEPKKDAA
jgi:hypothetical protein